MPEPKSPSPAVASLHDEQARQRTAPGTLDEGLEETFPASDPVSHTGTTIAGRSDGHEDHVAEEPAPKIDEALEAVKARYSQSSSDFAMDELKAMRAEVDRMLESAQEVASASGRVTRSKVNSLREEVAEQVRRHPLQVLGLAALAGYVWGMTR